MFRLLHCSDVLSRVGFLLVALACSLFIKSPTAQASGPSQPSDFNLPPLFIICPGDITVGITTNCYTTVQLPLPQIGLDECIDVPKLTISSSLGSGYGPFTGVPTGIYSIQCLATNQCGEEASCTYKVTVRDQKKPTILLKSGIIGNIGSNGKVVFRARQLNLGSQDNCTAASALRFSFSNNIADSTRTFDCTETGTHTVSINVFDAAGNKSTGISQIKVQDDALYCQRSEIFGNIRTYSGYSISGVNLTLNCNSNDKNYVTDDEGTFNFTNLAPNIICTLRPSKVDNPLIGINTYDLKLIYQHISGEKLLSTPYQMIAADVNNDGAITFADLQELRNMILGIQTNFQQNTAWRFVEEDFIFADTLNPFALGFPEFSTVQTFPNAVIEKNFLGIKIGDINGDAFSTSIYKSDGNDRSALNVFNLITEDQTFKKGQTVNVSFYAPQLGHEVLDFQSTLIFNMDNLSFQSVSPNECSGMSFDNIGMSNVDDGSLTLSYNGEAAPSNDTKHIIQALFTAKADGKLSDALHLNSKVTAAEAYDRTGNMLNVQLLFTEKPKFEGGVSLLTNHPNPFVEMTLLRFILPDEDNIVLTIFDHSGKEVYSKTGFFPKGENQCLLNRTNLGESGVYYYQLDSKFGSVARKLVML